MKTLKMRGAVAVIAAALLGQLGMVQAAEAPLASLTVKNQRTFFEQIQRVIDAAAPAGEGERFVEELQSELGIGETDSIDEERPWQAAFWFNPAWGAPLLSVYVPVTDFDEFKEVIEEKGHDVQVIQANRLAVVVAQFNPEAPENESALQAIRERAGAVPGSAEHAFAFKLAMTEPIRSQVLGGLQMGRMAMAQAFQNPEIAEQQPGFDPQAFGEVMGIYFDVIEGVVRGMSSLEIDADVSTAAIEIEQRVAAVPGSELAKWLAPKGGGLQGMLPHLDSAAAFSFAMRLTKDMLPQDFFKKLMAASMKMQKQPVEGDFLKQTEELISAMLPMSFAGSMDWGKGYGFSGVYQFDQGQGAKIYRQMLSMIESMRPFLTAETGIYSDLKFEAGVAEAGGSKVDRMTLVVNTDSPMLQAPGQKEMIEMMFPGGKMQMDMMLRGDSLYVASGRTIADAAARRQVEFPLTVDAATVVFGHVNPILLMKNMMGGNPMIPAEARERIESLNAEGGAVTFKMNVDGQLRSSSRIPLKLISNLGALK